MSEIKRSHTKTEKSKKRSKKRATSSSTSDSETESSDEDELPSGASKISKDDFYNKSGEFMYWLRKKRKLYLEDTPSKEAKRHFKTFVKKWNKGRLNQGYYDGSYVKHTNSSQRTKHHWTFSDKLDNVEMGILRDTVVSWTSKKETKKENTKSQIAEPPAKPKRIIGPSMMPPQTTYDKELTYEEKKKKKKYEEKKHRKHKEMVLDELLPKATGHEAKIEKRIAAAQQRKEREQSPEYGDGQLMGGGESIRSIMDKRKHKIDTKRTARAEKAKAKINAYEEKEKEKMKELMQLARESKSQQSMW